jgi:uncharacterized protein YndB with AHSA1/START domain
MTQRRSIMKSVIELEINAPQDRVAELFDNPRMFPRWMDDVDRVEPLSNTSYLSLGADFRIVPKTGKRIFRGRLLRREPPYRSRLRLEAPTVSVDRRGTFIRLSDQRTKVISEEVIGFKGLIGRVRGMLGRRAMKRLHRRHMESFKRFVESPA